MINKYRIPKIAKADLVHGVYYRGHCRNASIARWDENHQCFIHWRSKFGERFLEEIQHPEDQEYFDAFIVQERIENPEETIPVLELIPLSAN
jgi:hypothetical protein